MYLFHLTDDIVISTAKVIAISKVSPQAIAVAFQGTNEPLLVSYNSPEKRNDKFIKLTSALASSNAV